MSFTAYALNLEDLSLWRALNNVEKGFYIDVGAYDPILESVSYGFYRQGWRGVLVEPDEQAVIALRKERPQDVVEQVALGPTPGSLHLYAFEGTGHSCGDPLTAAQQVLAGFSLKETDVPMLTLDQVFEHHASGQEIQWLKIAVEGMEAAVLEGWSNNRFQPWVVVVNSIHPTTGMDTHDTWEHHLIAKGYGCARFDGINRFYVGEQRPDLHIAIASPAHGLNGVRVGGMPYHPLCGKTWTEAQRELEVLRCLALEAEARLAAIESSPWWWLTGPIRHWAGAASRLPGRVHRASWRIARNKLSRLLRRAARTRQGRSLQLRLPLRKWGEATGLLKPKALEGSRPLPQTASAKRYARWLVRPAHQDPAAVQKP
jgi:FkbM family methyltransferase